jgi:hypothetical protein
MPIKEELPKTTPESTGMECAEFIRVNRPKS